MNPADAQQIIDQYLAALVAGNLAAVLDLFAEDATVEDPVGSPVIQGREALAGFYQVAVDSVSAANTTGAVRCAGNEFTVPFAIEASLGAKVGIEIIDHFVVNDEGKISAMRAFWSKENVRPL